MSSVLLNTTSSHEKYIIVLIRPGTPNRDITVSGEDNHFFTVSPAKAFIHLCPVHIHDLLKYLLGSIDHIHIWQASPQLMVLIPSEVWDDITYPSPQI